MDGIGVDKWNSGCDGEWDNEGDGVVELWKIVFIMGSVCDEGELFWEGMKKNSELICVNGKGKTESVLRRWNG